MRFAPGVAVLRGYQRAWLPGDVVAGVTMAAYLVPQVMAYAGVAGLDPVAGLWAVLPAMTVYAVLGSSKQLSVGPESTTALMTAAVVAPLAAGDPDRYAGLAAATALVVGLLGVAARLLRLGFVADLLSAPILVGYMTGVAAIMIIGQLERTSGVPVDGDTLPAEVVDFGRGVAAGEAHVATALFSVVTLTFLLVVSLWSRRLPVRVPVPVPLLAVLLATLAVAGFGLDSHGIAVVGAVPSGLPTPSLLRLGELPSIVLPALGVLLVGYTDNVLTARAFAVRRGEQIDADQELLALGGANIAAGLFSGFPVSSSGSRTAVGDAAGSRTQVYSLVAAALVGCVLLFAGPLLEQFPTAALGALVIYAAIRLVDVAGFRRLASFRRSELLLAFAALAGVVFLDVLYGILAAVALSVADLLARVGRPHDAVLGRVPGLAGMHDVDDYPQATTIPGLVVYRYDAPLFFANAQDFGRRAREAVAQARRDDGELHWFVLNTEAIVEIDITAVDALEELRAELVGSGVVVALARVKQDLLADLRASGLAASIGEDRLYPTLPTALRAFELWVAGQAEHGPQGADL